MTPERSGTGPRVLIVADAASARQGGEAYLPLHYFSRLSARGVDVRLVSHARTRAELTETFPDALDRMHFVEDTWFDRLLWRAGNRIPAQLATVTTGALTQLETQIRQRRSIRRIVQQHSIDVVHQPAPVSPKQPSVLSDIGAPVVIGPMNGGMTFPPGFLERQARSSRAALAVARAGSSIANRIFTGKRDAARLLVANERTRASLPGVVRRVPVELIVENGVDLDRFRLRSPLVRREVDGPFRVAYVGRLVGWKAVDLLVAAVAEARTRLDVTLDVFGDGELAVDLAAQVHALGLDSSVTFHGFVPQEDVSVRLVEMDALALPSLYECGGAVVLEAMAIGLPVIATRWGGPADYLDDESGVLVEPLSRDQLVQDLAAAIERLAGDPDEAERLAAVARVRAESYDWETKVTEMLGVYRRVISAPG